MAMCVPECTDEVDHDPHQLSTVAVWIQPDSISHCHGNKGMP